jgi:hypothetical protein
LTVIDATVAVVAVTSRPSSDPESPPFFFDDGLPLCVLFLGFFLRDDFRIDDPAIVGISVFSETPGIGSLAEEQEAARKDKSTDNEQIDVKIRSQKALVYHKTGFERTNETPKPNETN